MNPIAMLNNYSNKIKKYSIFKYKAASIFDSCKVDFWYDLLLIERRDWKVYEILLN